MAKARTIIFLECTCDRGMRNYAYKVSKKRAYGKLALKKYCPRCRKHMLHKETK